MTSGVLALSTTAAPSCPICRAPSGRIRHVATQDRWFGVPGFWSFRQCHKCQGLWLDPRPTAEALPLAYFNYYTHAAAEKGRETPSSWSRIRPHLPWHACDRQGELGYLDGVPSGRVLDVGCGDGARIARLARDGWSPVGTDLDGKAVEAARKTTDAEVLIGTVHDIEPSETFDAVVMFHLLEHADDPLSTLVRALELLRPGGVLSVATPNAASWLHRIYGPLWRGLEPPRHLQLFTSAGLKALLTEAGFDEIQLFTTERNAGILACASERSFGSRSKTSRLGLVLKGEILQAVEWTALRWWPHCGEELVAIATKASSFR